MPFFIRLKHATLIAVACVLVLTLHACATSIQTTDDDTSTKDLNSDVVENPDQGVDTQMSVSPPTNPTNPTNTGAVTETLPEILKFDFSISTNKDSVLEGEMLEVYVNISSPQKHDIQGYINLRKSSLDDIDPNDWVSQKILFTLPQNTVRTTVVLESVLDQNYEINEVYEVAILELSSKVPIEYSTTNSIRSKTITLNDSIRAQIEPIVSTAEIQTPSVRNYLVPGSNPREKSLFTHLKQTFVDGKLESASDADINDIISSIYLCSEGLEQMDALNEAVREKRTTYDLYQPALYCRGEVDSVELKRQLRNLETIPDYLQRFIGEDGGRVVLDNTPDNPITELGLYAGVGQTGKIYGNLIVNVEHKNRRYLNQNLMVHETAHALDTLMGRYFSGVNTALSETNLYQSIYDNNQFNESAYFNEHLSDDTKSLAGVRSSYANINPYEHFAEAFRFYLDPYTNLLLESGMRDAYEFIKNNLDMLKEGLSKES